MGKGSSGGGETTTKTEPWAGVQPYLNDVFNQANVLQHGQSTSPSAMGPTQRGYSMAQITGGPAWDPQWYNQLGAPGGSIVQGTQLGVVPFTGEELEAQRRMTDYARGSLPSTLYSGANELNDVLSGSYLNAGNPHLEGMYSAATRPVVEDFQTEVLPALTGQFAAAGRRNSGAHQNVATAAVDDLTRNLADTSANIYGRNYEAERDRMMRGLSLSPVMAGAQREMELGNMGLLGQVGAAQREMAESILGQTNEAALEPWQRLGMYSDMLGQGMGFNTATAQGPKMHQNRLAGALGGGMAGAGMGMMIPGAGPFGAVAGGLGGLLLGGML